MQPINILRYDLTLEYLRIVYNGTEEKIFFADRQTYKPLLLQLGIVQGYSLDEDDNTVCLVKNDMGQILPWALADLDLNPAQLMAVVERHEWELNTKSVVANYQQSDLINNISN